MKTSAAIKTSLEGQAPRVPDLKPNLNGDSRSASLQPLSRTHRQAAFTMAEIAIALGVIAFALIAIIGILPTGLQTQRDNREETIVNQDARLLIEAIKSGGRDGSSDVGSFVVRIAGDPIDYGARNPPGIPTSDLVQLLSSFTSQTITFSAISGGVASRATDLGFRYQVTASVFGPTNVLASGNELLGGTGEFYGTVLADQVHEVRLRFAWPVKPDGSLGSEANRYTVRTVISGGTNNGVFYPQQYFQP